MSRRRVRCGCNYFGSGPIIPCLFARSFVSLAVPVTNDPDDATLVMGAADYYFAAEGSVHADTVSPSGCTALVSLTARAGEKWRAPLALA